MICKLGLLFLWVVLRFLKLPCGWTSPGTRRFSLDATLTAFSLDRIHLRKGSRACGHSAEGRESASVLGERVGAAPWRGGDPQHEGPVTPAEGGEVGTVIRWVTGTQTCSWEVASGPGSPCALCLWAWVRCVRGAHRQPVAGTGCCERL